MRGLRRPLCGLIWTVAMVGAGTAPAIAHEARPLYLEIDETGPGQYAVLWRTPVLGGMPLPVLLQLPEDVRDLRKPIKQELADSLLERRWIDAGPNGLAGRRIEFPGLQLTITDVVVRVSLLDGRSWMAVARPSEPWVEIEASRSTTAVVLDFLAQGIHHILSGPDHLLFVFGLLLIVSSPWVLVKTITAFTLAHSITLIAASLGYVRPPGPPIEAAIALSILFLAPEILRARRGGTSFTIRHPWVVAFAFGLLHGFAFASVMSAAGLPPADVPLALLSFNVGVEIGQLAFVGAVLLLAKILLRLNPPLPHFAEAVPAYVVGSLGAFWLIQRLVVL